MTKKIKLGELFCGPGGFAEGAHRTKKFEHIWAIDNHKDTTKTFKLNHPNTRVETWDLNTITKKQIRSLEPVEGLIFGFPCNDFSKIGKFPGLAGKYGPLYKKACHVLQNLKKKPDFFVAENVSNIAPLDKFNSTQGRVRIFDNFHIIMQDLAKCGYTIYADLLNFKDYSVPQIRKRVILFGIRSDLDKKKHYRKPRKTSGKKPITCKEALSKLKKYKNLENNEYIEHPKYIIQRLKKQKPGQNVWDINGLPGVKSARMSHIYKRLDPNLPAYTVTGSGGGGTYMYHYKEPRALSNRERATIQTFPIKYKFYGNRSSIRRQIGMAVPVKGAQAIMNNVYKTMKFTKKNLNHIEDHDWYIKAKTKKLFWRGEDLKKKHGIKKGKVK